MEEEDYMQHYIDIGAIEIIGVDPSGEFLLSITDKAKDVAPELWETHIEYIDKTLLDLFDKNLLEIEYDEELNVNFKISEKGKQLINQAGLFGIEDIAKKKIIE